MDMFGGIATMMVGTKIQEIGMVKKDDDESNTAETAANQPSEKAVKKTSRTNGGKIRSPFQTQAQKKAAKAAKKVNDEKPAEAEIVIVAETKPEPPEEIDFVAALRAAKLEDSDRKAKEEEERLKRIAKAKAEAEAKKEAEKQEKIQAFREAHDNLRKFKEQIKPIMPHSSMVVNRYNLIHIKEEAMGNREVATAGIIEKALLKFQSLWGISAAALKEAINAGFIPGDEFKNFAKEYGENEKFKAKKLARESSSQLKPVTPPTTTTKATAPLTTAPPLNSRPYHTEDSGTNSIADILKANGKDPEAFQNGGNGKKAAIEAAESIAKSAAVCPAETSEVPTNGEN